MVFENRVLKRILEFVRSEIADKTMHNDERRNFCSMPNIIRIMKLGVRWAGHVAHMAQKLNACGNLWGNQNGRDHYDFDVLLGLRSSGAG
jgi:hypothetical protein